MQQGRPAPISAGRPVYGAEQEVEMDSPAWPPAVGSVFLVPIGRGAFGACRVLQVASGKAVISGTAGPRVLLAACAWFGSVPPPIEEPVLRETLCLSHHRWAGSNQPVRGWIETPLPRSFRLLGTIEPDAAESGIAFDGRIGAASGMRRQMRDQYDWDYPPEETGAPVIVGHIKSDYGSFALEYDVSLATLSAMRTSPTEVALFLDARATGKPVSADPDAESAEDTFTAPHVSMTVYLPDLTLDALVGARFDVPSAFDSGRSVWVTNIYDGQHVGMDDNEVEIVSREGDRFLVRWRARTDDEYPLKPWVKSMDLAAWFTFEYALDWT